MSKKKRKKEIKTVLVKPRVMAICKAYNISYKTLVEYLKGIGFGHATRDEIIEDDDVLGLIDIQFKKDKVAKQKAGGWENIEFKKVQPNPNSTTSTVTSKQFDTKKIIPATPSDKANPVRDNVYDNYALKVLPLSENIFNEPKQQIAVKGYEFFRSYFNDEQAINLCSKMNDSFARRLCSDFRDSKRDKKIILYQIHYIANKALQVYGGKILSFILKLRKLDFKNHYAIEAQTYRKVIPDFPLITFVTNDDTFKISFFAKPDKNGKRKPQIRLFTNQYEPIGAVDVNGHIMNRLKKYTPRLNIFYEQMENGKFKIYSGVEKGNCEICHRPLEHPISLRLGIGPVCAKNIGLDISLYYHD